MAEKNAAALAPEIRVAQLLLERSGLRPPVPVRELLQARAEVVSGAIPGSADALVVRQAGLPKPRVILNSVRVNSNRERFTMAHELGHLILPWQAGTVFCHTDTTVVTSDSLYREIENEANRFAGELLVPMKWGLARLESLTGSLAEGILAIASSAEASPMVVAFSLSSGLTRAAVFVTEGESTILSFFGSVLGEKGSTTLSNSLRAEFLELGARHSTKDFGPYALHCFEFESLPAQRRTAESSSEVMKAIADDVTSNASERARLLARVNGIIGSANTRTTAATAQNLLLSLRVRFTNRPDLMVVVSHPRFERFLVAKAYELASKRGKG